eukprot:Nk52_evm2s1967 gene=Nk52_evmTU2s1967
MMQLKCVVALLLLCSTGLVGAIEHGSGFEYVTCGSVIKLTNSDSGYKLHSHEVKYGTGSGQQSVTGFPKRNDPNSYWIPSVVGRLCNRGGLIECGSTLTLRHSSTNKFLHSHLITSPLSGNQEVSAFGEDGNGDSGDHWLMECEGGKKYWERDQNVWFKHKDTGKYLRTEKSIRFGHPIDGQLEICAIPVKSNCGRWRATEGIYMEHEE